MVLFLLVALYLFGVLFLVAASIVALRDEPDVLWLIQMGLAPLLALFIAIFIVGWPLEIVLILLFPCRR